MSNQRSPSLPIVVRLRGNLKHFLCSYPLARESVNCRLIADAVASTAHILRSEQIICHHDTVLAITIRLQSIPTGPDLDGMHAMKGAH